MQLGLSPERGILLTGLQAGDDALITALDGTNDLTALGLLAEQHDAPTGRVTHLLRLLTEADLLVEQPTRRRPGGPADLGATDRFDLTRLGPARTARLAADADTWSLVYAGAGDGVRLLAGRTRRQVRVDGAGRVGAAIALTLAAAGIGHVQVDDEDPVRPTDLLPGGHCAEHLGQSRGAGVRARLGAAGERPRQPDLVVVVRDDLIDIGLADDLVRSGRPHLAVVCAEDRVVVGPLVLPGRGPCLRCLDLHRTDRDPAWPHLAAQLLAQAGRARPRGEVASSTAGAGLASLQVIGFFDELAVPATVGRTLEVTLPDGLVEARRWTAHPACGCSPPVPGDPAPAGPAPSGPGPARSIPRQDHRAANRAAHAPPAGMDDNGARD